MSLSDPGRGNHGFCVELRGECSSCRPASAGDPRHCGVHTKIDPYLQLADLASTRQAANRVRMA
jgi:hypothetical protein